MLEPTGPLPPSVYWRRRAVAAGAVVVGVVILAWLIGGLVGPDDEHPVHGTANSGELGTVVTSTAWVTSERVSASPSSTGPVSATSATSSAPSATVSTTPAAATTTSPTPSPRPAACADAVIRVAAAPAAPSYRVGARPLLKLRITNAGRVPCTRDVSRKLREILVLGANGARLWSSNDCYGPPQPYVRVLAPNQPVEFSVNWAGRTSAPGCPLARKTVPAGTYRVVGKLGPLTGPPSSLVLT